MIEHKWRSYFESALLFLFLAAILSLSLSSNLIDEGISSKIFGIFIVLTFFYELVLFLKFRKNLYGISYSRQLNKTIMICFIFVLVMLAGLIPLEDYSEGVGKWGRWLVFLVFPFIVSFFYKHRNQWYTLAVLACAISAFLMCVESVYLFYFKETGRYFSQYNPITYGVISGTLSLFLGGSYFAVENKYKWLAVLGCLCGLVATYFSETRGVWLGVIFAVIMSAFILSNSKKVKLSVFIFAALCCIALYLSYRLGWFPRINEGISSVIEYTNNPSVCSSWGARLAMWKGATLLALDSPFFGVGYGNWDESMHELVTNKEISMSCSVIYSHTAHSIYFHSLAESGFIGLVGLILFFVSVLMLILRSMKNYSNKVMPLLIVLAYACFGISTTWTAKSFTVSIFITFLACAFAVCLKTKAISDSYET